MNKLKTREATAMQRVAKLLDYSSVEWCKEEECYVGTREKSVARDSVHYCAGRFFVCHRLDELETIIERS